MNSAERRARINELIVEELREDGVLDPGDMVTHWLTLVNVHGLDDDAEEAGVVYRVLSDPPPSTPNALGMIEWQRMYMQARMTATVQQWDGDE